MNDNAEHTTIFLKIKNFKDFNPLSAGFMQCPPGFAPIERYNNHYIIHYVVSGKGYYTIFNKTYTVEAGHIFIIPPRVERTYVADAEDPWYYIWIDFNVSPSLNLDFISLVLKFDHPELFDNIKNSIDIEEYRTEYLYAQLLLIYRYLAPPESENNHYVNMIKYIVASRFTAPISVEYLANQCNINKDYANRIFKRETGLTITQYITQYKMNRALEFLEMGFSVENTAHMIGYDEYNSFTKKFKQHFGYPPSKAKKSSPISYNTPTRFISTPPDSNDS